MAGGVTGSAVDSMSRSVEDLPNEIWEDIPGHEGRYCISQYSRVKSIINGKDLILCKSLSSGKYKVVLRKRGRFVTENVGRLVASVFIRSAKENEVVKYKDGNKLNDDFKNLEWISRSESVKNTLKSYRGLGFNSGTKNGSAKINPVMAMEIRSKKIQGYTYRQISSLYNVSIPCIQKVVENRSWKTDLIR